MTPALITTWFATSVADAAARGLDVGGTCIVSAWLQARESMDVNGLIVVVLDEAGSTPRAMIYWRGELIGDITSERRILQVRLAISEQRIPDPGQPWPVPE